MDRRAARGIVEVVLDALTEAKSTDAHGGAYPIGSGNDTPSDGNNARSRRHFTLQLGGLFVLWVWITLLGFSYLLHYR